MPKSSPIPPLLPLRTAVVMLVGFVCGTAVGILTFLACGNVPAAVLAGLTTTGSAIVVLHRLID